ncbi:YafY family protein [Pleurocapsa sp. PCC 7319]|uniref:helix-turn-helix transcriptional regulator n=1 Tax=Pleurocapsa sp. PCC 7319 TaxID=118161 RepID=UPI00034A8217|nr:WYL domain-containing protein [Pleurocapsa sp. PCC 7319]
MSRKKETLTLSLSPGTKAKLEEIARELGFFWGKSPSPSAFVTAIANKEVQVGEPFYLSDNQIKALRQAIRILIDTGYTAEAEMIALHVLDKSQLELSVKKELLKVINQHLDKWRLVVEEYIKNKQPFEILYTNSQEQELIFNVHFAQIDFHEKRFYLNIWCEETEDVSAENKKYFPEILHNRCLRFDRIQGIIPKSGEWRGSLDYLEVHLQFTDWMVKAYKPREEDIADAISNRFRNVTRRVFNPFWLIREIKGYGKYCNITNPDGLRNCFRQELIEICQLYNIEI